MIEIRHLEVCHECLATVLTGHGEDWRVNLLWQTFRGELTISESSQVVTFRPCGACGSDGAGVRYGAVGTVRTGQDARDNE